MCTNLLPQSQLGWTQTPATLQMISMMNIYTYGVKEWILFIVYMNKENKYNSQYFHINVLGAYVTPLCWSWPKKNY